MFPAKSQILRAAKWPSPIDTDFNGLLEQARAVNMPGRLEINPKEKNAIVLRDEGFRGLGFGVQDLGSKGLGFLTPIETSHADPRRLETPTIGMICV